MTKKLAKEFKDTKNGHHRAPPTTKSGSEEIKYETGFDPVSGEVKGPDIDIGDLASTSFVEREVRDRSGREVGEEEEEEEQEGEGEGGRR